MIILLYFSITESTKFFISVVRVSSLNWSPAMYILVSIYIINIVTETV